MSDGNTPFWNAYNGSKNLAELDDEGAVEEAQIDHYATADEAMLALPREPKAKSETNKKRLLAFIGVPLVLLLAIIVLHGGGSSSSSSSAPAPIETAPAVVTPVVPAQQAQVAVSHGKRGGTEIVRLAKSLIASHFKGRTPSEAEVNAYVDKQLGLTQKVLQVSQLSPTHYLITYTAPDGTPVIQSINTDQ